MDDLTRTHFSQASVDPFDDIFLAVEQRFGTLVVDLREEGLKTAGHP
jgi:hypothetical protein